VLKSSPQSLFRLAELRLKREDVGSTATWHLGDGGPKVLLVHGFRGDHHGLLGVAGALPEVRFTIPDLPGFGKTPGLESGHSLENYGRWLADFSASSGGYDLVLGHSFGSLVVSSALSQGLSVEKVALQNPITTRASESSSLANRLVDRYYERGSKAGSNLLTSQLVVRGMSIALAKTKNPMLRRFIHRQHSSYFSVFESNKSVAEGYKAASTSSVLDFVDHLPKKLMAIAGDKDVVAPLEGQQKLAELAGADLRVIRGVGHLTHYERPSEVASHLSEFLVA
jgi:pimeloyl-ACP methyl ester carboxylesterase